MRTIENIKTKLKEIFIDAIGFNPFDKDEFYHHSLIERFMLNQIDFLEIVVRIEMEFHFNITNEEEEKIACMNIDKLTNFIHSKCSKC
jgi:acyl carrier protein